VETLILHLPNAKVHTAAEQLLPALQERARLMQAFIDEAYTTPTKAFVFSCKFYMWIGIRPYCPKKSVEKKKEL